MSLTTTTTTTTKTSTRPRLTAPTAIAASSSTTSLHGAAYSSRTPTRSLRKHIPTGARGGSRLSSRSTPNLGALFASQAAPPLPQVPQLPHHLPQTLAPAAQVSPLLVRKGSLAALTPSSLATIPDATESYAFDAIHPSPTSIDGPMAPLTPSRLAASFGASVSGAGSSDSLVVGDVVDVPGGMTGVVRFVGSVAGRKGVFAGVELQREYAVRGKNNGDVDGVSYFNTTTPGAGIFLPLNKAVRRDSPGSGLATTPTGSGLKLGNQNSTNFTPPTPSLPKFSQSVSAASSARAASPQGKRVARPSLPRPESPMRRIPMTPARPSMAPATKTPGRFGSPTPNKFSQSMRAPTAGGAGDPSKRGILGHGGSGLSAPKSNIGPRSVSALGRPASSHYGDDDTTPVGPVRTRTNGTGTGSSIGSASSFSQKTRPSSRAAGSVRNGSVDDEVGRLRAELADRERQLKDQASTLADMEGSLTELQTLIESPDGPLGLPNGGGGGGNDDSNGGGGGGGSGRGHGFDDEDAMQMRALLREKNDKIAMLTAEFDAHRADFRSTIDTLEMASTETERVYEKKIEELMLEIHELENRTTDVDAVAQQLKQLEELVQELEEGLEDARRGEAEARGEVEFLRGEVERTRTELLREREKVATAAANHAPGGGDNGHRSTSHAKDLEQKDDEIRGLKAIIHSLSQNASSDTPDKSPTVRPGSWRRTSGGSTSPHQHQRGESINERLARDQLEREVAELRATLDARNSRAAEMERELEQMRVATSRANTSNSNHHASRSSLRDSRSTVVLARDLHLQRENSVKTISSTGTATVTATTTKTMSVDRMSPEIPRRAAGHHHSRGLTLDTMPESDAYSSVTDASTLWCEICETNGHDILTCTNMFPQTNQEAPAAAPAGQKTGRDVVHAVGLRPTKGMVPPPLGSSLRGLAMQGDALPTPLSPVRMTTPMSVPPEVKILPNPMDSGPVAGKETGVVDPEKWCALCERDGHDSVDCPFEDAF